MATVRVSKEIAAPVDEVFRMFTDIERAAERVAGIESISMLSAGRGFSLGTRWRETRKILGRSDSADMEVTAFEVNRAYTITHHKGGLRIDTTFTFEPVPIGTRVGVEFAMSNQGLPPGLLSPLEWASATMVHSVIERDLSDLKSSLEQVVDRLEPSEARVRKAAELATNE